MEAGDPALNDGDTSLTEGDPSLESGNGSSPAAFVAAGVVAAAVASPTATLTLEQRLHLLDILFDRMPMGIIVTDRDGRLRHWNKTFQAFVEEIAGWSLNDLASGPQCHDLYRCENAEAVRPLIERALAGETVSQQALPLQFHGNVYYRDVVVTPLTEHGEVAGAVAVSVDVTGRELAYRTLEQRVEERTREVERRRQVAESLRGILAALNSSRTLNDILDYIAAQASQVLDADAVAIYRLRGGVFRIQIARGLDAEYVQRMFIRPGEGPLGRAVEARQPAAVTDIAAEILALPEVREDPIRRPLLDRLTTKYRALLAVPLIVKGEVYGGLALYYDSHRTLSDEEVGLAATFADQAALALENAKLRDQTTEEATSAERSRLARDLHDAVTQTLFSASLIADVLPRIWERVPAEGHRCLTDLRRLTRGALAEMRALLLELRPAALEEANLDCLLRQLAEAVAGRSRIAVALSIAELPPLPRDVKIALYRIAQEALNNAARHARASRVELALGALPRGVELRIADDGRGFDPARVSSEHLGLGIMRERADAIGAQLTIESAPGGTLVTAAWSRPAAGNAQQS
jgi:PAS domain S-box-containing protein